MILGILGYLDFSEKEIQSAFNELQKACLIKPTSLVNGISSRFAASQMEKRYVIADIRLQSLVDVIWELYHQKLSMMITKHHFGELDDTDRSWMAYIFGKENTSKILRGLEGNKRSASGFSKYKVDTNIAKWEGQREQIDFDEQVYNVFRSYKRVLQEYDFPLDLIYRLLGPTKGYV